MRKLSQFFLGDGIINNHDPESRRIMLSYQLTLFILLVGLIYILFDTSVGITDTWPIYLSFSVMMVLNLWIIRLKKYALSKHVILVVCNFVVYIFYARESYGTGAYLLFFPLFTVSYSLFDYKQRIVSYIYSISSLLLFLIAIYSDFTILENITLDEDKTRSNFIINFVISGAATIFSIVFLIKLNNQSEANLKSKEIDLENLTNKLTESNLRFELALNASSGGVWDWDLLNQSIYHTPKWRKEFGYPSTDQKWYLERSLELVHEDDQELVRDSIKDHFLEKKPYVAEYRLKNIQGEYRWIVDYGKAIWDDEDNPKRMVGFMVDITDRKLAEEKVQIQNKMLAKTNSELDRFVYSTSHDLRSPLMSVLGLIQLVKMETSIEEIRKYTSMMELRINHLDRFIQDIIHYSRNSRIDVVSEEFNVREVIDESLENIKYIDGVEKIDISCNANGTTIKTDKSRLKVIVNNIISNAVKYQKEGKKGFIKVDVDENDELIFIHVQDNGEGIKDERKDKIFDMFYRASESSTGTGLGLYIVKEMIEKIQGKIDFESEYGEGTTFKIILPKSLKKTEEDRELK